MKRWLLSFLCALLCSFVFVNIVALIASGMWALVVLWLIESPNLWLFVFLVVVAMIAFHRWVFKGKNSSK